MKKINIWKSSIFLKSVLIVAFVIIAGVLIFSRYSKDNGRNMNYYSGSNKSSDNFNEISSDPDKEKPDAGSAKGDPISVYICGCVNEPGVYECTTTDRVADIIKLAKGTTDDADLNGINLAKYVSDAEKIYIGPITGPDDSYGESQDPGDKEVYVNINTADSEKLCTLPGIGETRAKAIIDYRNKNGMFNEPEDIKNVAGIKDALYEKIKDLIRV